MSTTVDLLPAASERLRRYGMNDIGNRHIADGRDGLKPVQRRVLWAMYNMGVTSADKHAKQARVMGETTGRYHPHGELSVASAMVNMCQTRTKSPLIVGQGNWGSHVDGAAAARYIACYLSKYAQSVLLDPDEIACVPMIANYDDTMQEPLYLPAKFPNFLLQGCSGISYSVAVNVPPCEPQWILNSLKRIIEGRPLKLPENFNYRYGGQLAQLDKSWLKSQSGRALFRPSVRAYPDRRKLVLTSTVPGMNIESKLESLRELDYVHGVFGEDGTDEEGLFTIEFKKGTDFKKNAADIATKLYGSQSYNFIYVTRESEDDYVLKQSSPTEMLTTWIEWRTAFIVKVAKYRIGNVEKDNARLDLLLRLIAHRDEILKALKSAKSRDLLLKSVERILKCTSEEASYILGVPIVKLSTLEQQDLLDRVKENNKKIKYQKSIIAGPQVKLIEDAELAFSHIGAEL